MERDEFFDIIDQINPALEAQDHVKMCELANRLESFEKAKDYSKIKELIDLLRQQAMSKLFHRDQRRAKLEQIGISEENAKEVGNFKNQIVEAIENGQGTKALGIIDQLENYCVENELEEVYKTVQKLKNIAEGSDFNEK